MLTTAAFAASCLEALAPSGLGYRAMLDQRLSLRTVLCGAFALVLLASVSCKSDDGQPRGLSTEECSDACAKVAAADCGDAGSECVNNCVYAQSAADVYCVRVMSAYFDCFWSAASYVCDENARTLPVGCDAERNALQMCEDAASGNEGGAAGAAAAGGTGGAGGDDASAGSAGNAAGQASGGAETSVGGAGGAG